MISSVNASLEARRTREAESWPRPAACYDSRRYCTMVMRLVVDMFALSVALSARGEGWRILRNRPNSNVRSPARGNNMWPSFYFS